MDCDDKIWLVKRDNNPHANTPDIPRIARLAFPVAIEMQRFSNDAFDILDRCAKAAEVVLGVPRQLHGPLRAQRPSLFPFFS